MSGVAKLLNNATSTIGGDIFGDWHTWFGGPGDFIAWGDFGGGNVSLELSPDNGTTVIKVCGCSLSETGLVRFNLNHGLKVRAILDSAVGTPSGVYAEVF